MGWEAGSMACPRSWPWSSCFSSRKSLFMNLLLKLNRSELFIAIGETMDCARHFHAHLQEVLRGPLTLPCARTGCTLSAPPPRSTCLAGRGPAALGDCHWLYSVPWACLLAGGRDLARSGQKLYFSHFCLLLGTQYLQA